MVYLFVYFTGWHSIGSYISVGDWSALPAHHRTDLAALGSGMEVVAGGLEGDPLHGAFNTDLNMDVKDDIFLIIIYIKKKDYLQKNNKKQQCCSLQSVPVCLLVPSRTPEMHMDCSPADKKINQIMVSIGSLVLLPASCNGSKEIWLASFEHDKQKVWLPPPKINPMDLG